MFSTLIKCLPYLQCSLCNEPLIHLQVVQQAAGRGHYDVDAVGQPLGLCRAVAAAHDEAEGVDVVRHQLLHHAVRLHGQLTGGRQDDHAGA